METKQLSRLTVCSTIEIWQPRWKDRKVLIAKFKVADHNLITFTKTKSYPDTYYLSGKDIQQYPITSNGRIECYEVPLKELKLLERV